MDNTDSQNKIKKLLAEHLGIDASDISDQDSLVSDLHMDPADISAFAETLSSQGVDTNDIDLTEIDTFEDLANALEGSTFLD